MTDPRGVCRKRAEQLSPDVPYVRGWAEGRQAASALAATLEDLGLAADFPGLRADVNVDGEGVVTLGTINSEAAALLARLVATGLVAELRAEVCGAPAPRHATIAVNKSS
ncbi:hypothetical protein GCM10028832_07120 [Streptomyces sparsus]